MKYERTKLKYFLVLCIAIYANIFVFALPAVAMSATNFSPADNATDVDRSSDLVITFDETWWDGCSDKIKLLDSNGTKIQVWNMMDCPASGISGAGTSTLTINPSSTLAYSTNYYVIISGSAVYDSGMMTNYSITDTTTWNFKTEGASDVTAPSRISFSPPDNGTYVFSDQNLVITFDENIDVKTGDVTIKKLSDDSVFETIDVTGGKVTGNGGAAITINPANGFAANTSYYVEIDATAFDDESAKLLRVRSLQFYISAVIHIKCRIVET